MALPWTHFETHNFDDWAMLDDTLSPHADAFKAYWGYGIPAQLMDRATLEGRVKQAVPDYEPPAPVEGESLAE
jgi:hypothetical protein